MVVNSHGEITLGLVLTDNVLVKKVLDFLRARKSLETERRGCGRLGLSRLHLGEEFMSLFDAIVTNQRITFPTEEIGRLLTAKRAMFFSCHN